jgi:hypothetical protein
MPSTSSLAFPSCLTSKINPKGEPVMNNEKFTSAINELKKLERSLLEFATESCESAQDAHFEWHKRLLFRVRESWNEVIYLQREVGEYYEKGELSKVTSDSIYQHMMFAEIGFLVLFCDTKSLGSETEYLKTQVNLTRIEVCNFLGKKEYDITFYKEIYR